MQFGDYRVEIIPDTEFRLDGGAMFGVVPRVLWANVCPPDEHNRITMNMNCVFIDTGRERMLIETGIGEKWSDKQTAMYGITRQRSLAESLREIASVEPEDITIVVNTHLHFDHAGGNTTLNAAGLAVPAFPNARYFVSRGELEHAEAPSERDRASYLPDNWLPLIETGQLEAKGSLNMRWCPVCEWKRTPGTIARCSVGVLKLAAKPCSALLTWCRCGPTCRSHGLWDTICFRPRRWKSKKTAFAAGRTRRLGVSVLS